MDGYLDPENQELMSTSAFQHDPVSAILTVLLIGSLTSLARWVRRKARRKARRA